MKREINKFTIILGNFHTLALVLATKRKQKFSKDTKDLKHCDNLGGARWEVGRRFKKKRTYVIPMVDSC